MVTSRTTSAAAFAAGGAETEGDSRSTLASLRADDFEKYAASQSELIADMRRIISEEAEGRPITWVSHAIPSDQSSEYDHVRAIRTQLAEDVERGARATGGRFFNLSQVVAAIGQSNAFMKDGRDTAHFTDQAISILAGEYARLLGLRHHAESVSGLAIPA